MSSGTSAKTLFLQCLQRKAGAFCLFSMHITYPKENQNLNIKGIKSNEDNDD